MSSYFPNRWPISYLDLTKNMKTYIRRQQHRNIKHQDIKQKEPPQKYRLGTISNKTLPAGLNRFYMTITSPSASAVVHKIRLRSQRIEIVIDTRAIRFTGIERPVGKIAWHGGTNLPDTVARSDNHTRTMWLLTRGCTRTTGGGGYRTI